MDGARKPKRGANGAAKAPREHGFDDPRGFGADPEIQIAESDQPEHGARGGAASGRSAARRDYDEPGFEEDVVFGGDGRDARGGGGGRSRRDKSGSGRRRQSAPDEFEPVEASAVDPDLIAEEPPRRRRGGRAEGRRARVEPRASGRAASGGGLGWIGALATLLWIGGVASYAVGMHMAPVVDFDDFMQKMAIIPGRDKLIVLAAMLAPVGIIWLTVASGRRAEALAAELAALRSGEGAIAGAPVGSGVDAAAAADEAARAAEALAELEAGLEAAEARARRACAQLEAERATLTRLVEDFEADAERITTAFADARSSDNGAAVAALAREIAAALPSAAAVAAAPPAEPVAARVPEPPRPAPRRPLPRVEADPAPRPQRARAAERPAPRQQSGYGFGGADDGFDEPADDYAAPRRAPEPAPRDNEDAYGRQDAYDRQDAYNDVDAYDDGYEDDGYAGDDDYPADEYAAAERPASYPENDASYEDASDAQTPPARSAADPAALDWEKLVRAANFPDSEDDRETLDALYAVLSDPDAAALLQSAEDALSKLADLGLYMEDLTPDHAPVELWRSFILSGDRRDALDLGGVRDPHSIEDVANALDEDPSFIDVAERFMDRYEAMAERLLTQAPTAGMAVELADTRTGRAYMLIGRAGGRFG